VAAAHRDTEVNSEKSRRLPDTDRQSMTEALDQLENFVLQNDGKRKYKGVSMG